MRSVLLFVLSLLPVLVFAQVVSPFDSAALKQTVFVLSADSMRGRLTGSAEAKAAATYIAGRWQKAGLGPFEGKDYLVPFTTFAGNDNYNVMAVLPGRSKPQEYLVFTAHYDHIGTVTTVGRYGQKKNAEAGDTVYNGANDDASGVAALVALAEYYGTAKSNERSLIFIAFAGEEQGLNGSQAAARLFKAEKIKALLNFEMIGRPAMETRGLPYVTGGSITNLVLLLNKALQKAENNKKVYFVEDPYPDMQLFFRSDNASFAAKGVPAHTIAMTSPEDPYYHSLNDEVGTLDFAGMSRLLDKVVIAISGLVDGTQTPSRVKLK